MKLLLRGDKPCELQQQSSLKIEQLLVKSTDY